MERKKQTANGIIVSRAHRICMQPTFQVLQQPRRLANRQSPSAEFATHVENVNTYLNVNPKVKEPQFLTVPQHNSTTLKLFNLAMVFACCRAMAVLDIGTCGETLCRNFGELCIIKGRFVVAAFCIPHARLPLTSTRVGGTQGYQENQVHIVTVEGLKALNLKFQSIPLTYKFYSIATLQPF